MFIKPLDENIGINLHDLVLGNGLLDMALKAQAKTDKNRQIGHHQN